MTEDLEELQVSESPARAWARRASRVCSIPPNFSARSDAVSALLSMIGVELLGVLVGVLMGCPVGALAGWSGGSGRRRAG